MQVQQNDLDNFVAIVPFIAPKISNNVPVTMDN